MMIESTSFVSPVWVSSSAQGYESFCIVCCVRTRRRLSPVSRRPSSAIVGCRGMPVCRASDAETAERALRSRIEAHASSLGGPSSASAAPHVVERDTSAHAEISECVLAVEQKAGFGGPPRNMRRILPGAWRLVATDSAAVARNAGSLTGLSKLPGTRCTRVDVVLQQDGTARTVESVTALAVWRTSNSLIGKWSLSGNPPNVLEVTYAHAQLLGNLKLRADSKAVLRTTYCSQSLRIGRSRSGDFYVFLRD